MEGEPLLLFVSLEEGVTLRHWVTVELPEKQLVEEKEGVEVVHTL